LECHHAGIAIAPLFTEWIAAVELRLERDELLVERRIDLCTVLTWRLRATMRIPYIAAGSIISEYELPSESFFRFVQLSSRNRSPSALPPLAVKT
jgi:hypothetical protein